MFQNHKVIDVHGHMSTPPHFRGHLGGMVSLNTPNRKLDISDEQLENAQKSHLKGMDEIYDLQADPYEMINMMGQSQGPALIRNLDSLRQRLIKGNQ